MTTGEDARELSLKMHLVRKSHHQRKLRTLNQLKILTNPSNRFFEGNVSNHISINLVLALWKL